jgi:hypothetical protein
VLRDTAGRGIPGEAQLGGQITVVSVAGREREPEKIAAQIVH